MKEFRRQEEIIPSRSHFSKKKKKKKIQFYDLHIFCWATSGRAIFCDV